MYIYERVLILNSCFVVYYDVTETGCVAFGAGVQNLSPSFEEWGHDYLALSAVEETQGDKLDKHQKSAGYE